MIKICVYNFAWKVVTVFICFNDDEIIFLEESYLIYVLPAPYIVDMEYHRYIN